MQLKNIFQLLIIVSLSLSCGDGDDNSSPSSGGGDGGGSVAASVLPSLPTLDDRKTLIDTDTAPRTVSFTFTGDSVECSRNGGTTYSTCDSNSTLIWSVADYASQHRIRAIGSDTAEYTFTPSTSYPNLSFVTCDAHISGNIDFDTFATHLSTANKVICLNDGSTVAQDGDDAVSALLAGANGIVVIAATGDTATISSGYVNGVFETHGFDNLKFVGFNINSTAGGPGIYIRWFSGSASEPVDIEGMTIGCSGGASPTCIDTNSSNGTVSDPITVYGTTVTQAGAGSGYGIWNEGGHMVIESSTIIADYQPILNYWDGTMVITSSTIRGLKDVSTNSPGSISLYRQSQLTMTDSIVESSGAAAVELASIGTATGPSIIDVSNTTFKRRNVTNADQAVFFIDLRDGATNDNQVNSASNGNVFCNISAAGSNNKFNEVIDSGGQVNTGNMVIASQANSGSIVTCP